MKDDVKIYRPNYRHELGLFKTWVVMARNIIDSKDMMVQLFKRDFFAAYRKSFFGITWMFITPLVGIISWVFLQKTGVLNPGEVGVPYPVYVLIGTSMWGLFMNFFNAANSTLSSGQSLVLQVNYPHESLLIKQSAQTIANFSISFVMNIVVLFIFKVIPSWEIVFLPLIILPLFLFASSIGLITSMTSIVAVDISRMINMGMGMMLYATPIIYSDKVESAFVKAVIKFNPLTYLVCSARDIILYGRLYDVSGFLVCSGISLIMFLFAWRLFFISEARIIERMI